uniref:Secreted protein n=1 Tax=Ixodes ricinus TaxID=34613 RepID=A0A6B0UW37_IXORI
MHISRSVLWWMFCCLLDSSIDSVVKLIELYTVNSHLSERQFNKYFGTREIPHTSKHGKYCKKRKQTLSRLCKVKPERPRAEEQTLCKTYSATTAGNFGNPQYRSRAFSLRLRDCPRVPAATASSRCSHLPPRPSAKSYVIGGLRAVQTGH